MSVNPYIEWIPVPIPLYVAATGEPVTGAVMTPDGEWLALVDSDGIRWKTDCPLLAVMTLTANPNVCDREVAARWMTDARRLNADRASVDQLAATVRDALYPGMERMLQVISEFPGRDPVRPHPWKPGTVVSVMLANIPYATWTGFMLQDGSKVTTPWDAIRHFTVV